MMYDTVFFQRLRTMKLCKTTFSALASDCRESTLILQKKIKSQLIFYYVYILSWFFVKGNDEAFGVSLDKILSTPFIEIYLSPVVISAIFAFSCGNITSRVVLEKFKESLYSNYANIELDEYLYFMNHYPLSISQQLFHSPNYNRPMIELFNNAIISSIGFFVIIVPAGLNFYIMFTIIWEYYYLYYSLLPTLVFFLVFQFGGIITLAMGWDVFREKEHKST